MNIAIIGGGINGIMTARELLSNGHSVTIIEKKTMMSETSSSSSKLLHGGLRYLETKQFGLVKEALNERRWWLKKAPHLTNPVKLFIPIYRNSSRGRFIYKCGLILYDILAGKNNLSKHKYYSKENFLKNNPLIKSEGLVGGFSYYDAQMDDKNLGLWMLDELKNNHNLSVLENTEVVKLFTNGDLIFKNATHSFDRVVNISGPWASELLHSSGIKSDYSLDLVRGAHLLIDRKIPNGYFLETRIDNRIFFVLPYQGSTLVGTTEEYQQCASSVSATKDEIEYLIKAFNIYFKESISHQDVIRSFCGIRPLVSSGDDMSNTNRESAVEVKDRLITVFGGKWTTSRQLAKNVYSLI